MADSVDVSETERPSKKVKVQEDGVSILETLKSFENFKFARVLKESPENKTFVVQGTFTSVSDTSTTDTESAVIFLEKTQITESEVVDILSAGTAAEQIFHNDVYGNFLCYPPLKLNPIKATIIYPATEKHIAKYSTRQPHLLDETIDIYNSVTLPHITDSKLDFEVFWGTPRRLYTWLNHIKYISIFQWVNNILEHKKEADRIVFEDSHPETGFVLLPDLKWDCRTTANLYLTGIVVKRGIKSLRDLTAEHIPLLLNILDKGTVTAHIEFSPKK